MLAADGTWHDNVTCRCCRRRHPATWSCTEAKMVARAQEARRRNLNYNPTFEDSTMNPTPLSHLSPPAPGEVFAHRILGTVNALIDAVNALQASSGAARVAEVADAIGPMIDHRGWAKVTVAGLPAGARAKEHAPRHGLAWTVAETADLVRSYLTGATHQALADTHQRTVGGVTSHLAAVFRANGGGVASLASSLVAGWARAVQEDRL